MIPVKYRALICLASVGLGCGLFLLFGLQQHAEKMLNRWYSGVSSIFLSLFTALILLTLRGRLAEVRWLFAVCILLSYIASIGAYVSYFVIWEPERTSNTLAHVSIFSYLMVALLFPTATLTWLFGAFVGVFYLCLERLVRRVRAD